MGTKWEIVSIHTEQISEQQYREEALQDYADFGTMYDQLGYACPEEAVYDLVAADIEAEAAMMEHIAEDEIACSIATEAQTEDLRSALYTRAIGSQGGSIGGNVNNSIYAHIGFIVKKLQKKAIVEMTKLANRESSLDKDMHEAKRAEAKARLQNILIKDKQ